MRTALVANDRPRFAHALIYPVTVNTDSWCRISITDSSEFALHVDEIVTPRVRQAILDTRGASTFGGPNLGLGRGEVWLDSDEPGTVFNSDVWEVPGEECRNWNVEPTPTWLSSTWVFAAVATSQSSTSGLPPSRWEAASVQIDLDARNVEFALTVKSAERCRPLRFGHEKNQPVTRRLDPSFYSYIPENGPFFDIECSVKGAHGRVQRLYIRDETSLAAVGDDGFFVFFRPAGSVRKSTPASKGDPCSSNVSRCRAGLLCQLNVDGEYCEDPPR
jgi:hypothetical protein